MKMAIHVDNRPIITLIRHAGIKKPTLDTPLGNRALHSNSDPLYARKSVNQKKFGLRLIWNRLESAVNRLWCKECYWSRMICIGYTLESGCL